MAERRQAQKALKAEEKKPKEPTRYFDDERYVKEVLEAPLPKIPEPRDRDRDRVR